LHFEDHKINKAVDRRQLARRQFVVHRQYPVLSGVGGNEVSRMIILLMKM